MRWTVQLIAVVVSCAFASVARADFQPLNAPCAGGSIAGFGASGSDWLALCAAEDLGYPVKMSVQISHDLGKTFSGVAWDPTVAADLIFKRPQASGVAVGPDGAFYIGVVAETSQATQAHIARINPTSGQMTPAPGAISVPGNTRISPPSWDATGRTWVAYASGSYGGPLTLARLSAGGVPEYTSSPASLSVQDVGRFANVEVVPRGSEIYVRAGRQSYRLTGDSLAVAASGIPVLQEGTTVFASFGLSLDGGQSWMPGGARVVEGAPGLLVGSHILRRFSPALFSATGLEIPEGKVSRVIKVEQGLIAVHDQSKETQLSQTASYAPFLALHTGPIPPTPSNIGSIGQPLGNWLARANQLRGESGLPPLFGDELISRAAENHSRYWTMNTPDPKNILSLHSETPGSPGFTGESPADRCAAVGTTCGEEIMHSSRGPVDLAAASIDGWIVTAYHRDTLMRPTAIHIGGGQVDGAPSVIDGKGDGEGKLVGPIPVPSGKYSGPLAFRSGEAPDPAVACAGLGHTISYPAGPTLSMYVPAGTVSNWTLESPDGKAQPGCELQKSAPAMFIPDSPLKPNTRYSVKVSWTPTPAIGARDVSWTFTTGDGTTSGSGTDADTGTTPSGTSKCASRLTSARPGKHGRPLRVVVRTCGRVTVRATLYRIDKKGRRRSVRSKRIQIRKVGSAKFSLPTGRLAAGRYELRVRVVGGSGKSFRRLLRLR